MLTALELKALAFAGLLACLTGYHFVALHNAVAEQRDTDKADFTAQVAKVNADAKADHDAMQAQIDSAADASNAKLAQQMAAIQSRISTIGKNYAPTKSLPADCILDPERLRMAAQALAQ